MSFIQSSQNLLLNMPDTERLQEQHVDPKTQVNKEFYGETANKYSHIMTYNRKQSDLMAQRYDWRDTGSKGNENDSPLKS